MYQRMKLNAWLSMLCLAVLLLLPSAAFAEVQTVEADGYYTVGDGAEENFSVARERAKQDAMGRAAEQAAVYVEKFTAVKNHQLSASEVRTLAAQVLSIEEATFENTTEGNVFKIRCHVVARVKEEEALASLLSDKQQLKESLEREQEKDKKIAELNRQMEELNRQYQDAKTDSERAEIREQAKANDASFTAAQWVEQANRAYDAKDYTKAIAYCNMAIELDPKSLDAYFLLGDTYFQLRDFSNAIDSYRKMMPLVPPGGYGHDYAAIGNVYYETGDYNKAIEYYSKALEINPHIYGQFMRVGDVYKKLLQACDAKGGGYEKAIEAYKRVISKKTYSNVFSYNELGVVYDKMGDYSTAIEWFNKVMTKYPDFEETYYNLGNTYSHKGEKKKAIEYYDKYKERLSDYNDDGYFKLGNAYSDIGEYNKAIECFNKVIAINPKADGAYNNRGCAYEELGRRKEAKRDYAKAYELEPNDEIYRKNKKLSENW